MGTVKQIEQLVKLAEHLPEKDNRNEWLIIKEILRRAPNGVKERLLQVGRSVLPKRVEKREENVDAEELSVIALFTHNNVEILNRSMRSNDARQRTQGGFISCGNIQAIGFMAPLSAELWLKAIRARTDNTFIATHNLIKLWNDLPRKERWEVTDKYNEGRRYIDPDTIRRGFDYIRREYGEKDEREDFIKSITLPKPSEVLEWHKNSFVGKRYSYGPNNGQKTKEDQKTELEMGAGLSTIRFAMARTFKTEIVPGLEPIMVPEFLSRRNRTGN